MTILLPGPPWALPVSFSPDSSIAPELDYPNAERPVSWRKRLSGLEHRRSFSSFSEARAVRAECGP